MGYVLIVIAIFWMLIAITNKINGREHCQLGYSTKMYVYSSLLFWAVGLYLLPGEEKVTISNANASALDSQAVALVRSTMNSKKGFEFKTAKMSIGVGVLALNDACYWVNGRRVFACNGLAKNWSPGISYSPPAFSYDAVRKAIQERS